MNPKQGAIAFIGLGTMGAAMMPNLIRRGFRVAGYDIAPAAMQRVSTGGFRAAGSAMDAARDCNVVITMLPTSADVRAALFGPAGAVSSLAPGSLVLEMSTGDATATDQLAADLAARGIRCIDAPVGRTPREAA